MNTDIETKTNPALMNDSFADSRPSTRPAATMNERTTRHSDHSADGELAQVFERGDWPVALALYEHRNPGRVMVDINLESANIVEAMPRINGRSIPMNTDIENRASNQSMNDRFANSKPLTQPVATMNEVAIDSLNRHDEIKIYTGRSEYRFMLTDPVDLRGLLTGGQMGEELAEVNLLAIRDDDGFHLKDDVSAISKGMRIIFHIPAGERNLVTSPITRLVLLKNEN
ncbi:MAG: hypothetical protein L0229_13455 [Blastocatellia bacterium]|nr:hypothetical protein [Blastocatellia bacterium]